MNKIALKALVVTLLSSILAMIAYKFNVAEFVVNLLPDSISIPKDSENSVYDYYCLKAGGANAMEDPNVLIVNIDDYSRETIGRVVTALDAAGAKVIGLDVVFKEPHLSDSADIIKPLLDAKEKIVLGLGFVKNDQTGRLYGSYFARQYGFDEGITNVFDKGRKLISDYSFSQDGIYKSFPWSIAQKFDPTLNPVDINGQYVNYVDYFYDLKTVPYDAKEIVDGKQDYLDDLSQAVKGKIAIIGVVSDREDLHNVPTGDYIPGILVHAYSISSIINRNNIRKIGDFPLWILSIILCYIVSILFYSIKLRGFKLFSWVFKGIELLVMFVIMIVCIRLFRSGLFIDFTPYFIILAFQLCLSSIDFNVSKNGKYDEDK